MEIKLIHPDVTVPIYATPGSAAIDLCFMDDGFVLPKRTIYPNETVKVKTGIALNMDRTDLCAMILPRSGLGSRGLILGNTTGLIDSDYQGELMVTLWNRSDDCITISKGDRIAQLVFVPIVRPQFNVVKEFSITTERGSNGFGSTGV